MLVLNENSKCNFPIYNNDAMQFPYVLPHDNGTFNMLFECLKDVKSCSNYVLSFLRVSDGVCKLYNFLASAQATSDSLLDCNETRRKQTH